MPGEIEQPTALQHELMEGLMETIRLRSVLQAVLLQTLAKHPSGLAVEGFYDNIDSQYRFPEEWYRQIPSAASGYEELKRTGTF